MGRRVLRYAPELNKRVAARFGRRIGSWRVDETYVRVAGVWTYLYRAIGSAGETIEFMLYCGETLPTVGVVAGGPGPATSNQCRRAHVVP